MTSSPAKLNLQELKEVLEYRCLKTTAFNIAADFLRRPQFKKPVNLHDNKRFGYLRFEAGRLGVVPRLRWPGRFWAGTVTFAERSCSQVQPVPSAQPWQQ
jgi:hypothetical protein